jgi:hypothetical protein
MTAPPHGKGQGYIAKNSRARPDDAKAPQLTGKISVTCPVSRVTTEYWLDGYKKGALYTLRAKQAKPRQERQAAKVQRSQNRPGGATAARPGGAGAGRPGGSGAGRPGSVGPPPRPGGGST